MMPVRVLDATTIGVLAKDALERSCVANVLARFERSFYLDVGGELITIGDQSLHDGPLTIKAAALTVDLGIVLGQSWTLAPDQLRSADGLVIDLAQATVWRPGSSENRVAPTRLRAGLDTLLEILTMTPLAEDGLVRLALPDAIAITPVEKAAAPALSRLCTWLVHAFQRSPPADPDVIEGLVGLGPGLTPSGDDLLGGVLITCHHLGETAAVSRLGDAIDAAAAATHRISHAHLRAAVQGYGAAPLHQLLNALVADDRPAIAQALDAAAKIGHSSGLDAIAGMVLALSVWLEFRRQAEDTA
ncbi:MAG: DUF2877 domain-containing protein [Geminicoccaceae bacterium]